MENPSGDNVEVIETAAPSTEKDEQFNAIVGAIESFMMSLDVETRINRLKSAAVEDDSEVALRQHHATLVSQIRRELDDCLASTCILPDGADVAAMLQARREDVMDEVCDFYFACVDFETFQEVWKDSAP